MSLFIEQCNRTHSGQGVHYVQVRQGKKKLQLIPATRNSVTIAQDNQNKHHLHSACIFLKTCSGFLRFYWPESQAEVPLSITDVLKTSVQSLHRTRDAMFIMTAAMAQLKKTRVCNSLLPQTIRSAKISKVERGCIDKSSTFDGVDAAFLFIGWCMSLSSTSVSHGTYKPNSASSSTETTIPK